MGFPAPQVYSLNLILTSLIIYYTHQYSLKFLPQKYVEVSSRDTFKEACQIAKCVMGQMHVIYVVKQWWSFMLVCLMDAVALYTVVWTVSSELVQWPCRIRHRKSASPGHRCSFRVPKLGSVGFAFHARLEFGGGFVMPIPSNLFHDRWCKNFIPFVVALKISKTARYHTNEREREHLLLNGYCLTPHFRVYKDSL
jgi:hypothetical protein